jgi:autotransporter translocation and assembly factor TamB
MEIFKRVLIILLILLLVLAGFAVFALKSGFFTVDARDYVISLIKKNTGKDVRIGTIELGLYNNIVVHNVSMPVAMTFAGKGEFASISSIIIRFNLFDLISRKKDINSTLSSIIVDRPLIYLKKEKGAFNLEDFAKSFTLPAAGPEKGAIPLPINKIFIQNGKVVYEDRDNTFNSYVDNFSGTILLKDNPVLLRVNLSGKTKNSNRKNFMLDLDYYIGKSRFRGSIKISDALLNDWGAYFMQPKDFTISSGGFYVDAAASGTGFKPEQMKVYGYAGVKDGGIIIRNKIPVTEINGALEINSDRVNIRSAFFKVYGGKGVVKGAAGDIFGKMSFNAKAWITGINLGEFDAGLLTGTAKVFANASGNKDNQKADISLSLADGTVRGMPVRDISLKASLKDSVVKIDEIKGAIGSGSMTGGGTVDLKKGKNNYNLFLTADGLDARKITGAKEISGSMGVKLLVQGPLDRPKATIELRSVKIKYSGNDIDNLSAKVVADSGKISSNSSMSYKNYKNLALKSIINITNEKITIGDFKLTNGKDLLVDAKGGLVIKDGSLGVSVTARDIMLSDLAPDFLKGKDIDGAVRGTVFLKGTKEKPEAEMDLNMAALKIRGSYYRVTASVKYGDDVIKISGVNFNDSLKGSGELSLKKKIFNANFDVKSLKGDVISEFSGIKLLDNGLVDGKIFVKKEYAGFGGTINLEVSYSKGIYKGAKIDISGINNSFSINQLDVMQKKGLLKSTGSFTIKNDSEIRAIINGQLDRYRVNDKLEAGAVFTHSIDVFLGDEPTSFASSNIFKASKISFNGKPVDDLDLTLKTSGKSMPVFKLKWGEGYGAQGSINAEPEIPEVEAAIQLKDADLYRVFALLNSGKKPLAKESLVSGEFNVTGPVNRAKFDGSMSQDKGTTSGEGTLSLEKKKGIYSLASFGIKYNAVNVNLNDFMNLFDEKFKDTGILNGAGELKGTPGNLESAGSVIISAGKAANVPYDTIKADYTYKDKKIVLDKGEFNYKESYIKLDGSTFEIKGDNDYYATILLQMKDFTLKTYKFNGNVNFYGRIENDKKLKITGSAGSDNFIFRKHKFNPFVLNVNYGDDVLVLKTSKGSTVINAELGFAKDAVTFRKYTAVESDGNPMLNVSGAVQLHKETDSDVSIDIKDLDPQMANDLLGWDHTWTGKGNGNVKISGNTEEGLGITVLLTLSNGLVDGVDFDTVNGLVVIKDDSVNLSPLNNILLTKTGKYVISVGGIIPVPMSEGSAERLKGAEMNLNAKMKGGDLSVFKFLKFIDDASGPVDLDLTIKGTKEYPSVSGRLNITGGDLKLKYLFKDLKNIYANILFKDNVIDIYTLKGDTERGTLNVANLDEKKGGTMKLMKPYEINWKITNEGDKVRITDTDYMEFLSGDADLNLEMTGLLESPNIKGTMKFENTTVVFPVKMKTKFGQPAPVKEENNYAKKINWDVIIMGGENCRYYNNVYNTSADVTVRFNNDKPLKLSGRGNDMKIDGALEVSKGTYKYFNSELTMDEMKQSKILFDGDKKPMLDIFASTILHKFEFNRNLSYQNSFFSPATENNTDLTIYVRFLGRVSDVKLEITSEPPLDKNRLIYILTTGSDIDTNFRPEDALKYLDMAINNLLKNATDLINPQSLFKVKVNLENSDKLTGVSAQPTPGSLTRTANVKVNVNMPVAKNVTINYDASINDINNIAGQGVGIQNKVGFDWQLDSNSKISVSGSIGADPDNPGPASTPGKIDLRAQWGYSQPFASYGAKPMPTPTPTPKPVKTPGK